MCETELCRERYELALERIREIPEEHFGVPAMEAYFASEIGRASCRERV